MKGALGMERLTLKRLRRRASRGSPLLGTLEDMQKKVSGMGISIGAHIQLRRTWNLKGGSYTEDFERYEGSGISQRDSMKVTWREGSFTGNPKRC
jgi:hypothetical protein